MLKDLSGELLHKPVSSSFDIRFVSALLFRLRDAQCNTSSSIVTILTPHPSTAHTLLNDNVCVARLLQQRQLLLAAAHQHLFVLCHQKKDQAQTSETSHLLDLTSGSFPFRLLKFVLTHPE